MLSFEHVDVALIRELSEPCREITRTVLFRELVGRLAGRGRSSSIVSDVCRGRKQLMTILKGGVFVGRFRDDEVGEERFLYRSVIIANPACWRSGVGGRSRSVGFRARNVIPRLSRITIQSAFCAMLAHDLELSSFDHPCQQGTYGIYAVEENDEEGRQMYNNVGLALGEVGGTALRRKALTDETKPSERLSMVEPCR